MNFRKKCSLIISSSLLLLCCIQLLITDETVVYNNANYGTLGSFSDYNSDTTLQYDTTTTEIRYSSGLKYCPTANNSFLVLSSSIAIYISNHSGTIPYGAYCCKESPETTVNTSNISKIVVTVQGLNLCIKFYH